MKYMVEVTSKVTLEIDTDSEEQAVSEACETAWQYDPDEQNAVVISKALTKEEAIAMTDKANRDDDDSKVNKLSRRLEKALRGGGFIEKVD